MRFKKKCEGFIKFAIDLSEKARREGLLSLEEGIERVIDPFFKLALRLSIDGTDKDMIEMILTNHINYEKNKKKKQYMTIQKAAAISIQSGDNPRILETILNSYIGNFISA